jgi:hypothetical protein
MLLYDTAADTEALVEQACRLIRATLEKNYAASE